MPNVKEAIEEMIEESYLLGLSEEEIRRDFSRFIDTCYAVIRAHVRDRTAASGLAEDLARERTCVLIGRGDRLASVERGAAEGAEPAVQEPAEGLAEKAARRKRTILRAIGEVDPRLVRLIDEKRFRIAVRKTRRPRRPRARTADPGEAWGHLLLKGAYAATVLLIIILMYIGYAQTP